MIWTLTVNPALDLALTTPQLEIRRKLRCRRSRMTPGGGGINCSRAIAALGGESTALFTCGGETGEILTRHLRAEGVKTLPVAIGGATRINVLASPEGAQGDYRLLQAGPELREREWCELLRQLQDVLTPEDLLIASGSLPPGVPTDFYAQVAALAHSAGAQLLLDAPADALRQVLAQQSLFAIKPNRREWAEMRGCGRERAAMVAAAETLVRSECRARAVLISLGGEGALCVTREHSEQICVPEVQVAGTTGAGDSMFGAFALAASRGQSLEQAARYGVAAGAATVEEYGGGLCRPQRLAELLDRLRSDGGC